MKLVSARVIGFRSFSDSGDIEFASGINLLIGQNNAGKSALLRAIRPVMPDDRHRSPAKWAAYELPLPYVHLSIELSGDELREGVLRFGQQRLPLPQTALDPPTLLERLWQSPSIKINFVRSFNGNLEVDGYLSSVFDTTEAASPHSYALIHSVNGEVRFSALTNGPGTISQLAQNICVQDMFFFDAERFGIGESPHGFSDRLESNAQNLPAVLHTLSGTRGSLFQKLVAHLREIFATVGNLSVGPTRSNQLEVRVWPTEAMERVELSFPLNSSGTGISQVIAIMTAVITTNNAVIVIDEISSFLHPAAVKSLLRILQTEYSHHQYIISTHAPEVIGFSNPRTVHLVRREGYESKIVKLDLRDVDALREVADNLGASMADVFAADRVIWVEGPTEELCFPLLYHKATNRILPRGTIFTSVIATGDFMAKRRDKELVYQIYCRLSQAAVPLVVSVTFSFDSENLTGVEKDKMIRDSQGAMHFLPRRHIECYLINADAISAFIRSRDSEAASVNKEIVVTKLSELAASESFKVKEWAGDLNQAAWLEKVDAANLIAAVCMELSDNRVTFNKKDDTLSLIQSVQALNPDQLTGLEVYVRNLVEFAEATT